MAAFPEVRMRRLRRQPWIRDMVAEYSVSASDLIYPVFVKEEGEVEAIATLPECYRYPIEALVKHCRDVEALGIPAIALFPVVPAEKKDEQASEALNTDSLMCRAIAAVKEACPNLGVIADVALDPYTSHGHDGIIENGYVANDATVEILQQQALSYIKAGADIVAPSDMMDGRIKAIRSALDDAGYDEAMILSYAAKYASAFYGPFRDAVGSSAALKGDKKTYQMDPRNGGEALRELLLDIDESADMVMVKPGMPYLDIVFRVSEAVTVPVMAYQVSGEYAMLHALATQTNAPVEPLMMESLIAFKRAGACAVLTYAAPAIARLLADN